MLTTCDFDDVCAIVAKLRRLFHIILLNKSLFKIYF